SPNEPASIASSPRQPASDVDAALVLLVLADLHVDQRRLSGGRGALERGADLLWTLAVLAVPAERLDDLVVAGGGELGGDQSVPAVDGALRSHHLAPRAVVAHHADDRQLEAHRGVVLEAVQPERAVAVDDDDALSRMRGMGGQRERHPDPQRAERARIHPGALAGHRDDLRSGRHDAAAGTEHDRLAD